jgi:hypothetical protein
MLSKCIALNLKKTAHTHFLHPELIQSLSICDTRYIFLCTVQCDRGIECLRFLQIKIYDDNEGVRRAEIEKLGGTTQFSTFYERLKDIKDYHRKHPTVEATEPVDEESILNSQA